jgi:hypothetical protein
LRAILDEYSRAIRDFESVVLAIPASRYTARTVLADDEFADIRDILHHAVGSAHSYAFHINRAIDNLDGPFPKREYSVETPEIAMASMWDAFDHMVEVLGRIRDWDDNKQAGLRFVSRWKQPYDVEQMLEHAIVHILRHRRQIERWRDAELA